MATKVGIKYTFDLNGNQPWWNANLTSADPEWNENIPAWKTAFTAFQNNHSFTGTDSFKAKWELPGNDTVTTTYVVEGATADNIETLVRLQLWADDLKEMTLWRDTVYNPSKGIVRTNSEIVNV